jgi:hypothetical protein
MRSSLGRLSSTLGGIIFSAISPFTYRKELTMADPNAVLKEALTLKPAQKAELIDKLLSSLDKPDKDIDEFNTSNERKSITAK